MNENDINLEAGAYDDAPPCKYNLYVGCRDTSMCKECGWNPEVSKDRIVKKYGEEFVNALSDQE